MLEYEANDIKERFIDKTSSLTEEVSKNLKDISVANDRLSFLFQINEDVLDADFRQHSQAVLTQQPYIKKIIYASKIRKSHQEAEERKLRYEGYTGFVFRQFAGSQGRSSIFSDVIFPVKYIQPFTPYSSTWFGKDLLTFKYAQQVLYDVVSQNNKLQFSVVKPSGDVYLFSSVTFLNDTEVETISTENVFGVLGYQIDISEFMKPVLNKNENVVANVWLNDQQLYQTGNWVNNDLSMIQQSQNISFEGQNIVFNYQLPNLWSHIDYRIPLLVCIIGILVTAFAFFVVKNHLERHKILHDQKNLVEKKVKEKTKQLEEQAKQITMAYNHQLAITHELESFSYSISHDLRAPLRTISGFANMLAEDYGGQLNAEARDMLSRVESGAKKMSNLIDDLLDLSRISRQSLKQEKFSISSLVNEISEELRSRFPQDSFELKVTQDLMAEGDKNLVQIALINLLSNAVKYSAQSNPAKIEFGMFHKEGVPVYFVKDNGVGFNMAYANKLFVAFQRLHGKDFEGTGIGLAIVQRIINRHGGKVWAESEPGKGATFYFTLG